MYKHNGVTLPRNTPFRIGTQQFPANWLDLATPADLAQYGIIEEADPPPSLDEVKAAKLAELKAAWDNTQNLGIQTRGHTFLSGGKARAQLDRLLAAQANGITIPDTIRADDGTPVDFSAVTIKALYDAVIKVERAAEDNYWTKRAQVVAALSPEQVAAVTW